MKYILQSYVSGNPGQIDPSGNRNATVSATPAALMRVINTKDSPQNAVFSTSNSAIEIKAIRCIPVGAPGLREGLDSIPFRANFFFGQENFNLNLSKFNEWQPANVFLPDQNWSPGIYVYSFRAYYDAFQVKDEYKNLSFGFLVEIEIDSSDEVA